MEYLPSGTDRVAVPLSYMVWVCQKLLSIPCRVNLSALGALPKRSVTFSVTSCCSTEVTKPSAACTDSPLSEVAVTDPPY